MVFEFNTHFVQKKIKKKQPKTKNKIYFVTLRLHFSFYNKAWFNLNILEFGEKVWKKF